MGRWGRLVSLALVLSVLGAGLPQGRAVAEPDPDANTKTLRDRLVGTWILVSAIDIRKDGSKVNRWGANPKGTFIFTPEGRYAQMILRTDVGMFGGRNAASFGTYTINERDKTIITQVEGSSNPHYSGTERKRIILNLTGDELTYLNPANTSGTSVRAVWKRAR